MLPANLAKGRAAAARGYGEFVMLSPGLPALAAYRYSPYTIPTSGAAAAAAAAAVAAASQNAAAVTPAVHSHQISSLALTPTAANPAAITTQAGAANLNTSILQQQLAAAMASGLNGTNPALLNCLGGQLQQQQAGQQQQQAQQQAQALQLLGMDLGQNHLVETSALQPVPQFQTNTLSNSNPTCKPRMLQAVRAQAVTLNGSSDPALNYSMNNLINIQGLQTAANYQVPVGL